MLETHVFREDEAVRSDIPRSRAPKVNAESLVWFRLARSQDEEPSHGTAIPQFIILYINKADPRLLVPQRRGIGWTPKLRVLRGASVLVVAILTCLVHAR